jgi:hypothetical protein
LRLAARHGIDVREGGLAPAIMVTVALTAFAIASWIEATPQIYAIVAMALSASATAAIIGASKGGRMLGRLTLVRLAGKRAEPV